MATISELVTRFGFEIDDKGLKELQEGIDAVKDGVLGLGAALVGEAVGLYELVKNSSEAGLQLRIMSQETGIAASKLQELQYRAKLTDLSSDELSQGMAFLARNMTEAKNGSEEARKHFRQLGVSTAELRSGTLTTDQVLDRISRRFEHLPDGVQKAGFAMELFGRGGRRMIPFLNQLHNELDPVDKKILEMSMVTEDQIEASEKFHASMETLKTAFVGIGRVIGFGLLPVATEVVDNLKRWTIQNRELIKTNLTQFVQGMIVALKLTIKIADALIQSFAGLAHGIGGVKIMTELLLGAFAILSGVSILYGIGRVIQAVTTLGNSFAIANLKAVAIPIAIGAAMAAIFLIMEDIYSFFQGKDSFTGDLLKVLPEIGNLFKAVFEPIFGPFVNIITMIQDGMGGWKDIIKELGVLIVNVLLSPLRLVVSTISTATSILGRLIGSTKVQGVADALDSFSSDIRLQGRSGDVSGVTPQSALSGPNQKQTNTNLQVHQEFNFPPGTDPAIVGDKITNSVSNGLDDVLRSTNRATSNGGAY